jgi:hypothetical protein
MRCELADGAAAAGNPPTNWCGKPISLCVKCGRVSEPVAPSEPIVNPSFLIRFSSVKRNVPRAAKMHASEKKT